MFAEFAGCRSLHHHCRIWREEIQKSSNIQTVGKWKGGLSGRCVGGPTLSQCPGEGRSPEQTGAWGQPWQCELCWGDLQLRRGVSVRWRVSVSILESRSLLSWIKSVGRHTFARSLALFDFQNEIDPETICVVLTRPTRGGGCLTRHKLRHKVLRSPINRA